MSVHMHANIHAHTTQNIHTYMYIHASTVLHEPTIIHTDTHTYCKYTVQHMVHTVTCTCTHTPTHTYVRTYIHTHVHQQCSQSTWHTTSDKHCCSPSQSVISLLSWPTLAALALPGPATAGLTQWCSQHWDHLWVWLPGQGAG